jgi:hypothetical protein
VHGVTPEDTGTLNQCGFTDTSIHQVIGNLSFHSWHDIVCPHEQWDIYGPGWHESPANSILDTSFYNFPPTIVFESACTDVGLDPHIQLHYLYLVTSLDMPNEGGRSIKRGLSSTPPNSRKQSRSPLLQGQPSLLIST